MVDDKNKQILLGLNNVSVGKIRELRKKASTLSDRRKWLAYLSGALAIVAALSLSSLFVNTLGELGTDVMGGLLALMSGLITLYSPIFIGDDIEHMLAGVRDLEEHCSEIGYYTTQNDTTVTVETLRKICADQDRLGHRYDKYILAKLDSISAEAHSKLDEQLARLR